MNNCINGLLSLTFTLTAITIAIPALAQSQGYEIEEVVVTARQRTES